ncbi:MAG: hypothetical protein C5B50_13155 [Verrucomicrobia bacterium]|nr:MAG: hypothetical protein C5B50_13155 [Verrucomicrobiota bacterium]
MMLTKGVPLRPRRLCFASTPFCAELVRAALVGAIALVALGASRAFAANNVTVTLATGGSAISADTTSASGGTGAYTTITGPVLTENAKTVIGTGSIILNVPTGFEFSNGVNSVTVTVTGDAGLTIAATSTGTGVQSLAVTPTSTAITIWVRHQSTVNPGTLTWSGMGVRPTAGTPLGNGNITESGTASITYASGSAASNYGTLTEVAGATDHYSVTAATPQSAGVAFLVTATTQDKFSNTATNDNSTVVTLSSSTGHVKFDGNDNGLYNSSSGTLNAGTFTITANDSTAETVNITATDTASKTGTLSGMVVSANPPTGAFRSAATGNWGTTTTWQTWNGSSWVAATGTPDTTTPLTTIQSPNVVTVASSVTVSNVVVNSGGTITISANKVLTLSSGPGANLDIFGTVNGGGQVSGGAGTLLVVENGGTWDLSSSGANLTVNGTVTVAGGSVTTASNKGFSGSGTFYLTSGTVTIGAANTGGADWSFGGSFNMSGGTFILGHLWNTPVPSSWSMTGGTFKIQGANPTIEETTFSNLELACPAPSTATLGVGALTVSGNFAIDSGNRLNLGGVTSTANTLTQAGVTQTSGTYNSSNDSTYLTGTGSLVISSTGVSASNSTATAFPTTGVLNDGTQTSTITVTALDANNNPISGASVTISSTGSGNTISSPANTGANGQSTATIKSTVAETKTLTVTIAGTQINQQPTVGFGTGPLLSTQPASQSACNGSTATFSPTYSGTAPLSYAWRRRLNGGWGNSWTVTGTQYLQTSTQNENGGGVCTGFTSNNDINSANGFAWGLDAGTATRNFSALTAGQVFRIDMDNGGVDSAKTNGFRLQTSAPADLFRFFFPGGQSNYEYADSTGNHDTGIGFIRTGLRIEFHLVTSTTYTLLVTACGSSVKEFSGTLSAGSISRVLLENNNTSTGDANRLYFNNMIAGTFDDNAGNYTSALANGVDKGDQLYNSSTSSSLTTATLTTSDNGARFAVLVYSPFGVAISSDATVTVNARPTAVVSGSATKCSGVSATISAALTGASPWNVTWSDGQSQNGVTSSPATRSVSPSSNTTYTVTSLTDANCTSQAGDLTGSAVITVNTNPAITTTSLGGGTANSPYTSQTVTANSGSGSNYTFSVASGLPPGLSISSGGTISGTPTSAGTYNFTVVVTDSNGCQGSKGLSIVISCPTITVSPSALPNLVQGAAYTNTITASGSSGLIFSQSGTLPTGMTFNTGTGVFSGIPTATGNFSFTITATDNSPAACTGSTTYNVTVGAGASITTQPANQTTTSGQTATFSVTAAGSSTLSYAWRKRSNAGWGNTWTVSGTQTFDSSTDNDNSNPACTSFSANNDINSSNGNAWGIDGTGTATRGFSAMSAGQVFRIDLDNGNIDSGKTNGFRLQQASGATTLLWFYFRGGDANYSYFDGAGYHNSGIPFTYTGLRCEFHLVTSSTYILLVTRCGGTTQEFSGTLPAGSVNQILVENNNTSTGINNRLFFNNLIAGTSDDNAGNYTAALTTGADKGDQAIAGATSSTYTTPTLTTADSGTKFAVLVFNPYGETLSSDATLTVNKATPAISNVSAQSISYGKTSLTVTGTVSAAGPVYPVNGETVTASINGHAVNGTVTNSTGDFSITYNDASLATDGVSGSPYTITYSYTGNANLNAAPNNTSTSLTVTKATPNLTAPTASSITYGQTLASSILSGGSATNPNNNGAVAGSFAFTTPSTAPSAGTASQSITFTPTDSADYNTATTAANVTVNQLAVNLTGARIYDGTTAAAAGILSVANKVGSDNVTVGGTSATLASKNFGTESISSFSGLTLGGSASANYTLTGASGSVTVSKTNITVTAATNTRVYDGTTSAAATPTITAGSIQTGDTAPTWTETYDTRNVGTGKTLTPAGVVSDGNSGNNYNYTYATVTTGVITAKPLTVTGLSANNKCFDGTTTATLSGSAAFLTPEAAGAGTTSDGKPYTVDSVSPGGTPAGTFADANPGTGKSVTVSGVTVTGTGNGNYSATQPTGLTATIFALPSAHNATGGGAFCTGGSGVTVGLDNSDSGINYQLLRNGSPVGSPLAGTGSALNFGAQPAAGTYTVSASNTTTTCTTGMSGSATVVASLTDPLKWVSGSGAWQFSTTAGTWQDGAGNQATYCDGFDVLLDDSASTASPTITLNTTVAPISLTNNSTKNYTISGSGSVSGSASLTKLGTSTLTLSGNNSYTGPTVVSAGTLALNGSISNSPLITVGASGTLNATGRSDSTLALGSGQGLKGAGTVVGLLAVGSGATLFPGSGINSITNTGATSLQGGGTNIVKVIDAPNSAGVGYDTLTVSGNIGLQATSGNPFNIKLTSVNGSGAAGAVTNFNNNTNYTWTSASGTVTNYDPTLFNFDTSSFSNDLAGGQFLLQSGSLKIVFTNNHPPIAAPTNYTRTAGQNMKIVIASFMTNLTSDPDGQATLLQRFESIGGPMRTARGYYVSTNGTYLFYTNKLDNNLDSINYVITDNAPYRNGDSHRFATNSIIISTTTSGTSTNNIQITASGSSTNTLSFWGVPGLTYVAQYSTNLGPSALWFDLVTTNAPSNGVWTVIDNNATNASRFYRSKWQY